MKSFVIVNDAGGEDKRFLRDQHAESWTGKRQFACRFFDEDTVKRIIESYAGKRNFESLSYQPYEQTNI